MTNKLRMKIINIFIIFGILLLNLFIPLNVLADNKGEI